MSTDSANTTHSTSHLQVWTIWISVCSLFAVAPVATISPKPTVPVSGGIAELVQCTATGFPAPTISWFRNGVPFSGDGTTHLLPGSTVATMALFKVTKFIFATSVTRESAFTIITCTASNGVGTNTSDSTQLIVMCKSFVLVAACV